MSKSKVIGDCWAKGSEGYSCLLCPEEGKSETVFKTSGGSSNVIRHLRNVHKGKFVEQLPVAKSTQARLPFSPLNRTVNQQVS